MRRVSICRWLFHALLVCATGFVASHADAALTTNNWINLSSGKWETAGNWSLGLPSRSQSILTITNGSVSGKIITIDANTVSLALSSLTISNLFLSAPLSTQKNFLDLVNTGSTPLEILDTLTISSGASISITNSTLLVDGSGVTVSVFDDGDIWLNTGTLIVTNKIMELGAAGQGTLTISNGLMEAGSLELGAFAGSQGTLTVAGGTNSVNKLLLIGTSDCRATGTVTVAGGTLFVTNSSGSAVLDVENGTFTLSSGTVIVNTFVITNACAHFVRTGGTLIYSNVVLNANDDTDGEGIPNGYELAYGLDPLDPSNATKDSDGDGMTDLQEYLAGTDPTNSASVFRITSINREGNDIRVTWNCVSGRPYIVQADTPSTNGSYTNNFTDLSGLIFAFLSSTNYLDGGGATNKPARYYRVMLYQGPL